MDDEERLWEKDLSLAHPHVVAGEPRRRRMAGLRKPAKP
jgi:hypothetical protein